MDRRLNSLPRLHGVSSRKGGNMGAALSIAGADTHNDTATASIILTGRPNCELHESHAGPPRHVQAFSHHPKRPPKPW
jgi:hypothetical protein